MKQHLTIMLFSFVGICSGQEVSYSRIPEGFVFADENNRAGSCASPNGPIVCTELPDYPTYTEVYDAGCCYTINPAVKNATYCYTFTSPGTTATLDAAFTFTYGGGFSLWFSDFELFTCAPGCVLFGTGLVFTGLTPGQCYTWCFDTHFTGGGGGAGFTSMCPYFIYTTPLPIVLTDFTASADIDKILLKWTTFSESNCDSYTIYRSNDGILFQNLGSISGSGTTNIEKTYHFEDKNPVAGINYYYLQQTDFGGNTVNSEVISCNFDQLPVVVNYFTVSGQLIDYESVMSGVLLLKSSCNENCVYQLVVK